MMREGTYPHPKGYPLVAGLEVSGRIAEVGAGVAGLEPGTRVAAFIEEVLKPAVEAHPDSARARFLDAHWQLNGEPFTPDPSATLKSSGIDHKSMLTVITPELNGIAGSAS